MDKNTFTYPQKVESKNTSKALANILFGHRLKASQTLYEYLIEFLQVVISDKFIIDGEKDSKEYFPIDPNIDVRGMQYRPIAQMGLKRFVFFNRGKIDSRAPVDERAYARCVTVLKESMEAENKALCIRLIQSLLFGFNAVNQTRSWFDQSLLPICPEAIAPEGLGIKKLRNEAAKKEGEGDAAAVDRCFAFDRYTFMCRGGEVYYLHLLQAFQDEPELSKSVAAGLERLIHSFTPLSQLCKFIEKNWDNDINLTEEEKKITKYLGAIPSAYKPFGRMAIQELNQFLEVDIHAFEKMEVLSFGIILQLIRAMHGIAYQTMDKKSGWVMDMSSPKAPNAEMKKLAHERFSESEEMLEKYIYWGYEQFSDVLSKTESEESAVNKAKKNSIQLIRKLGKTIGIIIPLKGEKMRFTLSETAIKFFVFSLIEPNGRVTLDAFLDELYQHFGIVIDSEHYIRWMVENGEGRPGDVTCLNENKKAFAQRMKECGFLRDLSDATAMIENPYDREERNETAG